MEKTENRKAINDVFIRRQTHKREPGHPVNVFTLIKCQSFGHLGDKCSIAFLLQNDFICKNWFDFTLQLNAVSVLS